MLLVALLRYALRTGITGNCFICYQYYRCDALTLSQGAAEGVVLLDDILSQLRRLGLEDHEEPVAVHLVDSGYEVEVPLKDLLKHLRDAGVPTAKAVAVRSALSIGVSSPPARAEHVSDLLDCLVPVR
jgi:hypothetical protein